MASDTQPPATEKAKPASIWRNKDFVRLWAGYTTSAFGGQVTVVAFPLVAVVLLGAGEAEVGILGFVGKAPLLLFLFAGYWADRFRKRPTMIATDLARSVLLLVIPLLYLADVLSLFWLGVISFLLVTCFVFFEIANLSHFPFLVGREHIGPGNGHLQLSSSITQVVGRSFGGFLVGVFSAALVLIVNVVTYVLSAIAIAMIRKPEPVPQHEGGKPPKVLPSIAEGLKWALRHPLVRPTLIASLFYMFFYSGIEALLALWLIKELALPVYWFGIIMAIGGPGAILGALISVPILKRLGAGPGLFWASVVGNLSLFLVALATGPTWLKVTMVGATIFLLSLSGQVSMVNANTLRMTVTPLRLQGRVMASQRAMAFAAAPVGALLAGLIAAIPSIGMRPVMIVCAAGTIIPLIIFWFSPLPRTKELVAPDEEEPSRAS
ncbi:MFS transporter [Rhizohabitans arisaemae]|uniref:MFS transporter n=1 Tax=Rhizohabitans arisaemae TaxID=2720610 RepID=UPI0024B2740C|nr:MFS transporter [Rhizohabitans arisaemae]